MKFKIGQLVMVKNDERDLVHGPSFNKTDLNYLKGVKSKVVDTRNTGAWGEQYLLQCSEYWFGEEMLDECKINELDKIIERTNITISRIYGESLDDYRERVKAACMESKVYKCPRCKAKHHTTVNTYEGGRTVECLSCGEIFEVEDV